MKNMLFVLLAGLSCTGVLQAVTSRFYGSRLQKVEDMLNGVKTMDTAEAEKVLGEKAHVKDSSWKNSSGVLRYMTTIISDASDKKTGQNRKAIGVGS